MISNIKAVQKRQYLFSDDRREGKNKVCVLLSLSIFYFVAMASIKFR